MRLLLLLCLVLGPKLGWTKIIPENVTNTAQDQGSVDVTKNVPFGVTPDGRDARLAVDTAGRLIPAPSSSINVTPSTLVYVPITTVLQTFTTAYSVNLSVAASSFGATKVCWGGLGPSVGMYWELGLATPGGAGYYYAASTTPLCDEKLADGTYLNLSAIAQMATFTAKISYWRGQMKVIP